MGGALYIKAHQKTSQQPSASEKTQNHNASNHSAGQTGGVVDNNQGSAGKGAATNSSSAAATAHATSSTSGVITLTNPISGATIGNGTTITGTAAGLSQVQYRIKDTARGVIALGQLTVVNGSFSGTIQGLDPGSSSGTFEVYDYKNGNGPEENDAKINVSFK